MPNKNKMTYHFQMLCCRVSVGTWIDVTLPETASITDPETGLFWKLLSTQLCYF